MMRHPTASLCDRARAWAALAPDGELSEVERKLLRSHLDRCDHCAIFAARVAAVAAELSAASLQPLPRPVSVSVRRGRSVYAGVRAASAAAAVALMALGVASRAPLPTGEAGKLPRVTDFANTAEREVALIARRTENDHARAQFWQTPAGVVTRPI